MLRVCWLSTSYKGFVAQVLTIIVSRSFKFLRSAYRMIVSSARRENLNLFEHLWISLSFWQEKQWTKNWSLRNIASNGNFIWQMMVYLCCLRAIFKIWEEPIINHSAKAIVIELLKQNFVRSTVSKALSSVNNPQDSNRWFMFVCMSFTISNIASWVQRPLRKPYCEEYKSSCFFI